MLDLAKLEGCCSPGGRRLRDVERTELATLFRALADPVRLAILNRLALEDEVCVCHLVDQIGLSQPTVSHHLKLLSQAGLVSARHKGTWAYYRLVPASVAALGRVLGSQSRQQKRTVRFKGENQKLASLASR